MKFIKNIVLILVSMGCFSISLVQAGPNCIDKPATNQIRAMGISLGKKVQSRIEQTEAVMVFIARVGMDLKEYNQHYTHMAAAVLDPITKIWQAYHLYNNCNESNSQLLDTTIVDFFDTDLHAFDALLMIPSPQTQIMLRNVFANARHRSKLHNKNYNLIAHPFNPKFQNSNKWILETIALGLATPQRIFKAEDASQWLQQAGYVPEGIKIPNLRRTGARLFAPNIYFSDHTQEEYEEQNYLVVGVQSIVNFLTKIDPDFVAYTIELN